MIVALIGVIGYMMVYYNHYKTTTTTTTTTSATKPTTSTIKTTTSPNPYADWKTYTNSTYGLSFKYPSRWSVYAQPNGGNLSLYVSEVTPAVLQKTTTSPAQDANYLEVDIFVSKNSVSNSASNPDASYLIKLGSMTYNGKSYSLIGEAPLTGQSSSGSVALVGVYDCPSGLTSCGEFLPTSKGGSIAISAYAPVIGQDPTVPIDINGTQYSDATMIFKSLAF